MPGQAKRLHTTKSVRRRSDESAGFPVQLFDDSRDAVLLLDSGFTLAYANHSAAALFNTVPVALTGIALKKLFPRDAGGRILTLLKAARDDGKYRFDEACYPQWDRWFENHVYPSPAGILLIFRDITESRKSATRLLQSNRLYSFISAVNQLIMHVADPESLFRELCTVSVKTGLYKMAWVGLINQATGEVEPVVFAGNEDGYLTRIKKIKTEARSAGKGPTGTAIRNGNAVVCADIETDPRMKPWRKEALTRGYFSSIAVPLRRGGEVIGAYSLYAGEKNFFNEEEVRLLQEAAADISYALDNFELESRRKQAEEAVKTSEQKLRRIFDTANDVLFMLELIPPADFRIVSANKRFVQQTGLTEDKITGYPVEQSLPPGAAAKLKEHSLLAIREQRSVQYQDVSDFPSGKRTGILTVSPVTDAEAEKQFLICSVNDITELKANLDKLDFINERFRLITHATHDALWEWNLETGELWGNETHQQLYGLKPDDPVPLADSWALRIHPEERARVLKQQEKNLESSANIFLTEYRFLNGKNEYRHILDRCFISRNAAGKAIRMLGSMQDVTEIKQAEEELKNIGRQLQLLGDNLPNTMIYQVTRETDGRYHFTYVSREVEKLTGRKPSDVMRNPELLYELLLPADRTIFNQAEEASFRTMEPLDIEVRSYNFTGEIRWLNIRSVPRRLDDGRVVWDGVHTDITDRKLAEEQILREKELTDTLLDSMPGIVYLINQEGRLLRWNSNLEKTTGYTGEEISRMSPLQFFAATEQPLIAAKIAETLQQGEASVEGGLMGKDGSVTPYYFTGRKLVYAGEVSLMGVGLDITDKRQAQLDTEQANAQLRLLTTHLQDIREDERKRIGREIHDELGQQLTAIKMDVVWLEKRIPREDTQIRAKLAAMVGLLDSSHHAIRKILNELRMGILEHQELEDALKWAARQFTEHTEIPVILDAPGNLKIEEEAVSNCIFRVFQEALTNISKHAGATTVHATLSQDAQQLRLQIQDNGQGIEAEELKKPGAFGVLGMKERVSSLQGSFDLQSAKGKGTRIDIKLPLAVQAN